MKAGDQQSTSHQSSSILLPFCKTNTSSIRKTKENKTKPEKNQKQELAESAEKTSDMRLSPKLEN